MAILLLVPIGLFILLWPAWRRQKRIQYWRRQLALDQHHSHFQDLYREVDGFQLSKSARVKQDSMAYVYGEIEFESFIALLSLCQPGPETIFYDLGSGAGKALLACAMVYPIKKCIGIELFPELHQTAVQQSLRLKDLPDYANKASPIEFRQGNFLDEVFSDGSIIFINATAFFGDHWQAISHHLEQVQPGTLVISTSKCLQSTGFLTQKVTSVKMSWGIVDAYIQSRLS